MEHLLFLNVPNLVLKADKAILDILFVAVIGGRGRAKGELEGGKRSRGIRFGAALSTIHLHF